MKFVAVADLHGCLPPIPECDVLLIAGDVCPWATLNEQAWWLHGPFRDWLERVPANVVVGIGGNHDEVFERTPFATLRLPWRYLFDSSTRVGRSSSSEGLGIYGIPWTDGVPGAFNRGREWAADRFAEVPVGIDILLAHAAPQGPVGGRYGLDAANRAIDRVRPRAYVCGHVHEGYGKDAQSGTTVVNASHMTTGGMYGVNDPLVFELDA